MAAYVDLVPLEQSDPLRKKIRVAIAVTAVAITGEDGATPNHAQRMAWAKAALGNPDTEVLRIIWYAIGKYNALDVSAIETATDADVQTTVDEAVALFAA